MSLIGKKDLVALVSEKVIRSTRGLAEDTEIWQVSNGVGKGGGRHSAAITSLAYQRRPCSFST